MSLPPAGRRNRKIIINKRSGAVDALNRPIENDWIKHAEKWAEPRGQTGMGVIRGGAQGVDTTLNAYSFRILFDSTITTGMQLVDDMGTYDIVDVRHDKSKREWTDIVTNSGNDG